MAIIGTTTTGLSLVHAFTPFNTLSHAVSLQLSYYNVNFRNYVYCKPSSFRVIWPSTFSMSRSFSALCLCRRAVVRGLGLGLGL
jgi:hypothetical protein